MECPQMPEDLKTAQALALFQAMIAALPEPVLLVSPIKRVEAANSAARDLFGPTVAGMPALAVLRQPDVSAMLERALEALESGTDPGPFESRLEHGTPSRDITFSVSAHLLGPEAGVRGLVVSLRDISHIEEAEQQRRDFVANVSHELRSPLTVLVGFIETLRGPARDDAQAREHFLTIMNREAGRMTRLVGDLLQLSKVESHEKVRPRDRANLSDVVHATLAALRPQIEDAGIQVLFEDLPSADPIPGDRDQLVQVCMNLVENALKYGSSGKRIDIALIRHADRPGMAGPVLALSVTDYGEGIDALHIPRLTERFYRVDSHRSREAGGTGLGLAIVKHIINRHRGRLSIRSRRGEGSSFTVLLPCQ
jgi:two-component system, OmpR family, phosphate regulon sensor histidine kinase PhoR